MRFAITAAALAALSATAVAQDSQTWDDATLSPTAEVTSTVTKTLSIVHTETVWNQSASSSTAVAASSQPSSPAEATSAAGPSAAPIATPTVGESGVNGAAALSFDVILAVVAAGAVTFWSS